MISKGFMHKDELKLILGDKFFNQFRNHIKFDTNFIGKLKENGKAITINDISFAIIKKGGKYDLEPYLTFNYN